MNFFRRKKPPKADEETEGQDPQVLKFSREQCWLARDQFFACCKEAGIVFKPGVNPPPQCAEARKTYEKVCIPSWVRHFDRRHDPSAQAARKAYDNINKKGQQLKGQLAGRDDAEQDEA